MTKFFSPSKLHDRQLMQQTADSVARELYPPRPRIKVSSTVHPEEKLEFNDWAKHIHSQLNSKR